MYKDDEGKIRVNWKAIAFMVIFLLGIIIGWNMSENIRTKSAVLKPISVLRNMSRTTVEDVNYMAEALYYENYCNGREAMLLTGYVIRNRRDYCKWCPDTVKEVLLQKGQYSTKGKFFTKGIPTECKSLALRILIFPNPTPKDLIYQAQFKQGHNVYKQIGTDYFCTGD